MSGIVAVWQRDGTPVDQAALRAMLAAQAHRAIHGEQVWISPDGAMALAHQHFWTTPEDAGSRQPAVDGDLALALDGRLDNRAELLAALGYDSATGASLSDADLLLAACQRWGEAVLDRLMGPFAFVLFDTRRRQALCARDAVGRRTLCYHLDPRRLVMASEPASLVTGAGLPDDVDDVWLAHFLAVSAPSDGRTPLAAARELLPAHGWLVTPERERRWCFWQADPVPRLRYRRDEDYHEHYRDLLRRAVARRMRAPTTPGVLMSGGLDSTSVAAMAAEWLTNQRPGERLRSFSWVFDKLTSVDERAYITPVVERFDLDATFVPGDDGWALRPVPDGWDANGPEYEVYRYLVDHTLTAARVAGSPVLLSGYGGDELCSGEEHWLADLVAAGRGREALSEIRLHARRLGWAHVARSQTVRRLLARPLRRLGLGRRSTAVRAPWLTTYAAGLVERSRSFPPSVATAVRPGQHELTLGAVAASRVLLFGPRMHRLGVEVREPLRDRDLIAFALGLPGYMLYNGGAVKRIVRDAMKETLPACVVDRSRRTDMQPLMDRGVRDREAARIQVVWQAPDAAWRRHVQPHQVWADAPDPGDPRDERALLRALACEEWLVGWADYSAAEIPLRMPLLSVSTRTRSRAVTMGGSYVDQ